MQSMNMCHYSSLYTDTNAVHECVTIQVYISISMQSMNMCHYSSLYTDTNAVHEYVSLFKFTSQYQCSQLVRKDIDVTEHKRL
jgi:hypothetical protein